MRPTTTSRTSHIKFNQSQAQQSNGFRSTVQLRNLSTQENPFETSKSIFRAPKQSAMQSDMGGMFGLGLVGLALGAFFWNKKDEASMTSAALALPESQTAHKTVDESKGDKGKKEAKAGASKNKPDVIFFLGGAGSNSDDYAYQASKEFGWTVIKTEELIKSEIASGSEKGKLFQKKLNNGEKLPADMVVELIERAVTKEGLGNKRFIIADFPRNADDATTWDRNMDNKVNLRMVFLVDNPSADDKRKVSSVDKPYTKGDYIGNVSYQQQSLGVVKQYPGLTTKLVDSKEPQQVMSQVRDVFKYIDNEQQENRPDLSGSVGRKQIGHSAGSAK